MQWPWRRKQETTISILPKPSANLALRSAVQKAQAVTVIAHPVKLPELLPSVVPAGEKSGIAMDSNFSNYVTAYGGKGVEVAGFPGYPYLAALATRAEYRAFASALSTELTREWITINSSETAGDETKQKVTELTKALDDMGLKCIIQRAAEHDCYFGRAQIFLEIAGHAPDTPLVLSDKTIAKGSKIKVKTVEAIWTTPTAYNALDPLQPDFYHPVKWFMLGKQVHASRLMTVITRPVPDMLKPAFNFGGMSLSQLAEPYVNNWLRTRQSVSDLIANFSVTAIKTRMDQVLSGSGDPDLDGGAANDLFMRAALFTATRANQGLMMLDNDTEDLVQVNTPLGGLHELQAQSQEHMCAVSRMPAMILTGISPSGLNASSEGEIRSFYDWIKAQQEAHWRAVIDTVLKVLQFSMYGSVDPDIWFSFVSLYQMTPKELAEIRTADATTAAAYMDRGVIDPAEQREKLARDPESGYQGLDLSLTIPNPNEDEDDENEDED